MSRADTASSLPGVKHKVIGLVSGGKDSCFNMMHTVANGHELVALATLTPEPGIGEIAVKAELTVRRDRLAHVPVGWNNYPSPYR